MREVQHPEDHPWVTTSVVDEEAIDHERIVGIVAVTGETVSVRIAQRVDFDLLTEPIGIRVSPPRITLGGTFEMTVAQAAEMAERLGEAVSRAERLPGTVQRPRLVATT